jgi:transposase
MPDQITMDELIHLVREQAQKIVLLEEKIDKLELELEKYKVRKDSNNSSVPPSKDENRSPRTSSLRQKRPRLLIRSLNTVHVFAQNAVKT